MLDSYNLRAAKIDIFARYASIQGQCCLGTRFFTVTSDVKEDFRVLNVCCSNLNIPVI